MKNIALPFLASLCISFSLFAQDKSEYGVPYNADEQMIIYQDVVSVPGIDAGKLFNRANSWASDYYVNLGEKVFEKEEGKVLGINGDFRMDENDFGSERIRYKLQIEFKDDRYRYKIFKLHIKKGYFFALERWLDPDQREPEAAKADFAIIDKKIKDIIASFKAYISNPPKEKKDEW